jgi:hypothetical protein
MGRSCRRWPGIAPGVLAELVLGAIVLGAIAVAAPPRALAQDAPAAANEEPDGSPRSAHAEPLGPEGYRGRTRSPTAAEVLAWIPRVVLFPLHLVAEYLVRVPIYALLEWAERNRVFALLALLFRPTPDISWSPTLSLEAGIFALPGLQLEWRNLGVAGHDARIAGTFAGTDFFSVAARDRWRAGPFFAGVRGGHSTRPDRAFYGLGPAAPNVRTNFAETRSDATAFVGMALESHFRGELSAGWARESIGPGRSPATQALGVPGAGPFDLVLVSLDLALDSRADAGEDGGIRLAAGATYGLDVGDASNRFLTAQVDLEAAVEIADPHRVLAARAHVAETLPLGGAPIPFLHLPTLGWGDHRGFVGGRFRGEAAVLAEIRYRYPIQYFVDLQWIASVGNVFARDFSDFTPGALTASFGIGLRTRRTGWDPIEATLAIGTTRFDSNVSIESVRFYVSTTQGL